MKKIFEEFKKFALKGSMVDLAIGVVIGGAFGKVVNSLVSDIIMPPIGSLLTGVHFQQFALSLRIPHVGAAVTWPIGSFLTTILEFFIISGVIFLVVRGMNRLHRSKEQDKPITKNCPFCFETIPERAVKCSHCTSDL